MFYPSCPKAIKKQSYPSNVNDKNFPEVSIYEHQDIETKINCFACLSENIVGTGK
jgi:hypothetical protein